MATLYTTGYRTYPELSKYIDMLSYDRTIMQQIQERMTFTRQGMDNSQEPFFVSLCGVVGLKLISNDGDVSETLAFDGFIGETGLIQVLTEFSWGVVAELGDNEGTTSSMIESFSFVVNFTSSKRDGDVVAVLLAQAIREEFPLGFTEKQIRLHGLYCNTRWLLRDSIKSFSPMICRNIRNIGRGERQSLKILPLK